MPTLLPSSVGGVLVCFNKLQGMGFLVHLPVAKDGMPGPEAVPVGDYWSSHGCYEYSSTGDGAAALGQAKACLDALYLEEGDPLFSWV